MSKAPILYTIPFSHFCEKARWGLDLAGIQYDEVKRLPLFHMPTMAWALRGEKQATADNSSSRYSTPMFRTSEGDRLCHSNDILQYADQKQVIKPSLFEQSTTFDIVETFDATLGPHSRRVAYHHMLDDRLVLRDTVEKNTGWAQTLAFKMLRGLPALALRRALNINQVSSDASIAKVRSSFDFAAELLRENKFLAGPQFGAADLTFAALASPVLLPSKEEGFSAYLPSPSMVVEEFQTIVAEFRAHPAGLFAMDVYRKHRPMRRQ